MIRGIVFDKDGTLLDYEQFWLPVAKAAISSLLTHHDLPLSQTELLLDAIGAHDGISGILCSGTYADITDCMNEALQRENRTATPFTVAEVATAFEHHVGAGELAPTCHELLSVLLQLKARGLFLAVVTSDNRPMTEHCLDRLGILEVFDALYTDDGTLPPKPNPAALQSICHDFSLAPHELIMVGDTLTDMRFASNGGAMPVGIARRSADYDILMTMAGMVIRDISELIPYLDGHSASVS